MPDPKRYLEDWSAITPTDFGLHAAYWTGKPDEPVTFRPILGWITYNAKEVGSPPDTLLKNGFGAVVLSDAWWPLLAFQINDYGGVFQDSGSRDGQVQDRRVAHLGRRAVSDQRARGRQGMTTAGEEIP